jgi:hypothetical protein
MDADSIRTQAVETLRHVAARCSIGFQPDRLRAVCQKLEPRSVNCLTTSILAWSRWWLSLESEHPLTEPEQVSAFIRHLDSTRRPPGSINAIVWAMKHFLMAMDLPNKDSLRLLEQVLVSVAHAVKRRDRSREVAIFGRGDLEACIASVDPLSAQDVRDVAILHVLFETMAAPDQIFGVRLEKRWVLPPLRRAALVIDNDGTGTLELDAVGKHRARTAKLSALTVAWIVRWLECRSDSSPELFLANSGRPLIATAWRLGISDLVRRARISSSFKFRAFRRGMAHDQMLAGKTASELCRTPLWRSIGPIQRAMRAPVRRAHSPPPVAIGECLRLSSRRRSRMRAYCQDLFESTADTPRKTG